jgi:hypothetical protein
VSPPPPVAEASPGPVGTSQRPAPDAADPGEPPPPDDPDDDGHRAAQPVAVAATQAQPLGAASPGSAAPRDGIGGDTLLARWRDVVDQVKTRNTLLASALLSAQPVEATNNVLRVAFATEFNRNSAEKASNRQLIEKACERVYGVSYRLQSIVRDAADSPSLLDDPVINYATRTFGGQPRRVSADQPGL